MKKPAANQYPIHELLKSRWSPRSFSSRPIEPEKMFSLFEAARWSPSGGNLQPWVFIAVSQDDAENHRRFVAILNGRNAQWAKSAPLLVLAVAQRDRQEGRPNDWAMYDLGQAVSNLTFQASALNLYLRQMGGFDREQARDVFEIPVGFDPVTAIAIGYLGELDDLPEDLRARELEGRSRKPLADFVFDGRWNEPIQKIIEVVA
jgi:nitroreductase